MAFPRIKDRLTTILLIVIVILGALVYFSWDTRITLNEMKMISDQQATEIITKLNEIKTEVSASNIELSGKVSEIEKEVKDLKTAIQNIHPETIQNVSYQNNYIQQIINSINFVIVLNVAIAVISIEVAILAIKIFVNKRNAKNKKYHADPQREKEHSKY